MSSIGILNELVAKIVGGLHIFDTSKNPGIIMIGNFRYVVSL